MCAQGVLCLLVYCHLYFPVFLPGKSHRQGSLSGYSPQGCREWDATEQARTLTLVLPRPMNFPCCSGRRDPYMAMKLLKTGPVDPSSLQGCRLWTAGEPLLKPPGTPTLHWFSSGPSGVQGGGAVGSGGRGISEVPVAKTQGPRDPL